MPSLCTLTATIAVVATLLTQPVYGQQATDNAAAPIATVANPSAKPSPSIKDITWLVGTWQQKQGDVTIVERWTNVGQSVLRGQGEVVPKAGDPKPMESLLLAEMSGSVFYFAKVKQHPRPIAFKMTTADATQAIFENRDHDFPQKIDYQLIAKDRLKVTISGSDRKPITFRFSRTKK